MIDLKSYLRITQVQLFSNHNIICSCGHKEKLAKNPDFHFAPAHCALQRAAAVAAYGKVMAEEGKAISGNELELIYLRKSQAEREREERLKKEAAEHV